MKPKVLRITTVPIYMNIVLRGQLRYLNQPYDVVAVTSYDPKHFNEIREREGVKIWQVTLRRRIAIWDDLKALFTIVKIIKKEKPVIVHTQTPKAGLLGMVAASICNTKVKVHTITGMPLMGYTGIKRAMLIIVERFYLALATQLYSNSLGLLEYVVSNSICRADAIRVILNGSSNGVDIDFFDPEKESDIKMKNELTISAGDFVFLYVGRIGKEKGISELVAAFIEVRRRCLGVKLKLILVGKLEQEHGPLLKQTEELIKSHQDIILPGRFDDVRPFYKLSKAFVLPSYREGFPNVVLEAGAMGLPSIVSNINGCNEIIQHNHNGLLVPPRDVDSLADAMTKLVLDNSLRDRLAANARASITARFDRVSVCEAIKMEYDRLLHVAQQA